MPEGDTIFRTARALDRALRGRVVVGFETVLAKVARVNDDSPIVGRVVERVESRGKWCLIWFSGGVRREPLALVTHMLMHGSWHLYRMGERWRTPRGAMRVVIRVGPAVVEPNHAMKPHEGPTQERREQMQVSPLRSAPVEMTQFEEGSEASGSGAEQVGWEAVAFNVPVVEWHTVRSLERSSQVPRLGPDVLSGEFTVEAGVARLEAHARENPDAEVGVVLLNQRVLAGLGNVYKSEVAFAAGVNPWRRMGTVTRGEMERMVEFALRYMKANVAEGKGEGIVTAGLRRTTGRMDKEERLWVYRRQGQECRRCGAVVRMRRQGEQARSTYWCPGCQVWVGEGEEPAASRRWGEERRANFY